MSIICLINFNCFFSFFVKNFVATCVHLSLEQNSSLLLLNNYDQNPSQQFLYSEFLYLHIFYIFLYHRKEIKQKIHLFSLTIIILHIHSRFWKHYMYWLNFIIIMEVINKVFIIFFYQKKPCQTLIHYQYLLLLKKQDLSSSKVYLFQFQYHQTLITLFYL